MSSDSVLNNSFHIGEIVFVPVLETKKPDTPFTPYEVPRVRVLEGVIECITMRKPSVEEASYLLYRVRGREDVYKEVWCREWQMLRTAGEVYDHMRTMFQRAADEFDCVSACIN